MYQKFKITIALLIFVFMQAPLIAGGSSVRMSMATSTVLTLKGTSTLHDFECTTKTVQGIIEMDSLARTFAIANIRIPVKEIHSGNSSMDENMYESLKAEAYPEITFSLLNASITNDSTHKLTGTLKIAGTEKIVDLDIVVRKKAGGVISASGTKKILMTDFGIKPPTFMFGALKTGNEVVVEFNIELKEIRLSTQQ